MVQLGMKYGLNNTHGQPTTEESFSILDTALAEGIDTFDTAYAYGTAEDVLGAWIRERSLAGKVRESSEKHSRPYPTSARTHIRKICMASVSNTACPERSRGARFGNASTG